MAVGDIIRLTVNQNLQSSVVQNVLYYKIETEDTSGDDVKALAEEFIQDVVTAIWAPEVSDSLIFECVDAQKVFPGDVEALRAFPIGIPGEQTGTSLPATNCALIQKVNLAQGGVGKKGRVYIAGFLEEDTAEGRWNALAFARLGSIASILQGDVTTPLSGVYEPVWVVRTVAGVITGFVEDLIFNNLPRVATQRRRRTPVRSVTILP